MSNSSCVLAFLLFLAASPAPAGQEEAADAEELGQDLIKNIDAWIGQVNGKLQSDKPVSAEDFDSIFNESFFSASEDPIKDLELAQKKIGAKLGEKQKDFDASYGKWVSGKLSPADLNPEVVPDDEHITVKLRNPQAEDGSMKVKIDGRRIKINYAREEKRQVTNPDGSVSSSSFTRRNQRVMAVPKGADPDKYTVRASKGMVRIIFDRKKGRKRTEASK